MKLTEEERKEFNHLYSIKDSVIPLTQEQFERLRYLRKKEIHNNCSNPMCGGHGGCEGHEGTEDEMICPNCGYRLFKLI